MLTLRTPFVIAPIALLGLAGCATRRVNPPIAHLDRLRSAAGTIVHDSPEFQRFLQDADGRIIDEPQPAGVSR